MFVKDSLRFVRVQQGDAHKRLSTRAQNAIYSGDKNKTKFTSIPWLTLSRCLLIEIRAKHDQLIDWVRPTQPPV